MAELVPIRVSELPEVTTAADSDYLVIDNGTQTSRITSENYNATASESAKHYANEALLSAQNAELQAGAASDSADAAENKAQEANASAQDAEAWAAGKRNGADVPSTDEAYHNNAKYFSEQAHTSATESASSADDAAQSAASISGLEDQIEQNTEDVTALKSAIEEIEPLSDDAKTALLNCFAHVAWADEHGQVYYDALSDALYAQEVRLSAVFTQGSDKYYPFDSLNALKENLVVTYTNEQGQSSVVTNYTLSGTLQTGTTSITVTYSGKTTSFQVVVDDVAITNNAGIGRILRQGTSDYYAHYSDDLTARCRFSAPIKNRDYTINIVDTSKYAVAGYDLANDVLTEFATDIGTKIGYLLIPDASPSWKTSWDVTGNYIWCAFKKNDGTDFTSAEIANAYGTIYTVS